MKYALYKNLSKEEQEEVRKGYTSTKKGEEIMKKYNRLYIYCIVYIIITIGLTIGVILDFFKWYYLIFAGVLVITAIVFFFNIRKLKIEQYCKYITICNKLNDLKKTKKKN